MGEIAQNRVFGHIPARKHKTTAVSASSTITIQEVHSEVPVMAERKEKEEEEEEDQ